MATSFQYKFVEAAHDLYAAMVEQSTEEVMADGSRLKVWRGNLTDLYESLGISTAHYSKVRKVLLDHECVEWVQKGTAAYASMIVLHKPPPPVIENIDDYRLTDSPTAATLDLRVQKVEAWIQRLGGLDVIEALRNHEERLAQLEEFPPKAGS